MHLKLPAIQKGVSLFVRWRKHAEAFVSSLYEDLENHILSLDECLPKTKLLNKIRILTVAQFILISFIPKLRWIADSQAVFYSKLLAEPLNFTGTLVKQEAIYSRFLEKTRNQASQPQTITENKHLGMVWPDEEDYRRFMTSDTSSRIVTSIHMGNYWHAFMRIAASTDLQGRRSISIRRTQPTEYEQAVYSNLSKLGLDIEIMRHDTLDPLKILKMLRGGNTTLSCQFDLTQNFGRTVPVEFFGRQAHFVCGPAEIAVAARVPIYPFVTFFDNGNDQIEMANPIDTSLFHGEDIKQASQRITQQLVRLAEKWIRDRPHQWQYIKHANTFFKNPDRHINLS